MKSFLLRVCLFLVGSLLLGLASVPVSVVPVSTLFPDKGLTANEAGEDFDGDVLAGVRTHLPRQVLPLAAQFALQ